jgi:hypothetical protein
MMLFALMREDILNMVSMLRMSSVLSGIIDLSGTRVQLIRVASGRTRNARGVGGRSGGCVQRCCVVRVDS